MYEGLGGLVYWVCRSGGDRLGIIWMGFNPDWGDSSVWLLSFIYQAIALRLCTKLVIVVVTIVICLEISWTHWDTLHRSLFDASRRCLGFSSSCCCWSALVVISFVILRHC